GTPKALSLIALLPPQHRLRRSSDFRLTSRRGRRVGTRTVVVHARKRDGGQVAEGKTNEDQTLVGFVVGKRVGHAVARNTVKRRLRHLVRLRLCELPASWTVVVRALPPAADAASAELGADLDHALSVLSGGVASVGGGVR